MNKITTTANQPETNVVDGPRDTAPISSHRHGEGQFQREAWGKREKCATCTAADARMEQGRKWLAERKAEEQDKKVNELLGRDERPSFAPGIIPDIEINELAARTAVKCVVICTIVSVLAYLAGALSYGGVQ